MAAAGWWTDERVEQLKRMLLEGHSSSVIGTVMGTTRNAIIGKASRLDLPRPDTKQGRRANQRRQSRLHARKDGSMTVFGTVRKVADGKSMMRRVKEALYSGMRNIDVANHLNVDQHFVSAIKSQTFIGAEIHDPVLDVAAKPLTELENGDCRWPVGDPQKPDFGFCARPKKLGSSYCEGHTKRSLAPLPKPSSRPFVLYKPGVRSSVKEDA